MIKELLKRATQLVVKLLPYALLIGFGVLCWQWFDFATKNQQDVYTPIVNGVIGGVVTSFLILVFSIVWKSNITPWVENLLYRDTKIEGIWSGVLVPYIGIDEIDSRRVKVAFGIIEKRRKKRAQKQSGDEAQSESKDVSASVSSDTGEEREIEAELILKNKSKDGSQEEIIERKAFLAIGAPIGTIEVRVEIKRVGHSLSGEIVEIGGMSQIHTYTVKGSFKNLIVTGEYENKDCTHIDRGSLSMMLLENGKLLEGFFSSYADSEHRMAPFKCVLRRQREQRE